ncbi:SUKH-4 family immunity protein [Streptomyces sp. CSDS2]|uniref:SUKH-4 family immunity protein n=1 Tax=Streptomyces sp. CSDS2 TaxID=3055051 RepID=UPI00339D3E71
MRACSSTSITRRRSARPRCHPRTSPGTGIVYQYTDAVREVIPLHGDVSSLVKTMVSFLGYISSYSRGEDEDDYEEYARRKREVGALLDAIRRIDPLPFAHEHSEWVELFDNLEGGVFT